ncbi:MAG: HAMP domain-containing protein [Treponema sp.]|jgi:class 3 adenylate cyclase|nr:HAMP domain-containing protein [Treponema sp.]
MKNHKKASMMFALCVAICIFCTLVCALNFDLLKQPVFQNKTPLDFASSAIYEKDGNLYVIDSGAFRLVCMTPEGQINYTITIDKLKEYVKFFDCAIDEGGNLYVYAMEIEYDAFLTKRDIIRKYDRKGNFIKDILIIAYADDSEDRPHVFPQFGSMRCENGILTFSRTQENRVMLYSYDTFRDELASQVFSQGISDYSVARLALKDFDNFIYTTRDGAVYEVQDGAPPALRGSFDFTEDAGGIIPWHLDYDTDGNIVFFDMISGIIYRIDRGGIEKALPGGFFDDLHAQGIDPVLAQFGFWKEGFAGVYGNVVWYYNGREFKTYGEGITLPPANRLAITAVQASFVLGIASFLFGIYLLFVYIFDRYISLFIKQIVLTIPITIAAFAVLYSVTFNVMNERLNREIFRELLFTATAVSDLIDGDDVDRLKSIKDFRSDAYRKLSKTIKQIIGGNRDEWNELYYAAIYKVIGNVEYYLMVSNDEMNMFRPYGYIKIEEGTGEYDLIVKGKPFADIIDYLDGKWAYVNVPLYNSAGKFAGFFEIGLDMISYEISNAVQQRQVSIIAALICLVILATLITVMSIVVRQLRMVAGVLNAISGGNYAARIKYSGRDELGRVSWGLNRMAGELQAQFEQICKLNESTIRFVPVQFMEHLRVPDITKMKLGDYVQQDMTVLFFDIRSFSINSEIMQARENFLFINQVLGIAGPIIRGHKGFVDKYLGDAVMALFVDARDAVRAGIELYQKLVLEAQVTIGEDGINIGVGLHSGSVMMGIVGENERLSSTVISKNVNLASRMESLTKQTKSGMLITRDVMNQLSGCETEFEYRFIGMIEPAGVIEVIGVFDMLDALPDEVKARRLATKSIFESGIRNYHIKEYAIACERFEQVVAMDPSDVCAANCLAETRRRLADPDLPSVFVFNRK